LGDGSENIVTDPVTPRVVDGLEAVQVDVEKGQTASK
jgi:hypothetical protein